MTIQNSISLSNISPAMAEMWLKNNYKNQRPLRSSTVSHYANEMRNGSWLPTGSVAFAMTKNGAVLVNGQHTLHAVIESGVTLSMYPVMRIQCQSDEELSGLYARFDIGKKRTFSDSVRAYGVTGKTGLGSKEIDALAGSIRYMAVGIGANNSLFYSREKLSNEVVLEYIYQASPLFSVLLDRIDRSGLSGAKKVEYRMISRTAYPLFVILCNHGYFEQAVSFWANVVNPESCSYVSPQAQLHTWLLSAKIAGGSSFSGLTYPDYLAGVVYAWNKFIEGKPIKRGIKHDLGRRWRVSGIGDIEWITLNDISLNPLGF